MLRPRMGVLLDVGVGSLAGVLQALSALLIVGALAWSLRRWLARGGLRRAGSTLDLEARLPLHPRGALVIVRAERRRFLLATHELGPARLIAELPDATAEARLDAPLDLAAERGDGARPAAPDESP
jgi:flagellar biogenesis protein FliO